MRIGIKIAQFMLMCGCLAMGCQAQASLMLFTDRAEFMQAISGDAILDDDLGDLADGYYGNPIMRSQDTMFEYMMQSSDIVGLLSIGDMISTLYPNSAIEIESQSGAIQAIGGDFGLTDYNGVSTTGFLDVLLQDGTSYSLDLTEGSSFIGVIGSGELISSLTIGSGDKISLVTATSMVIASTPGPGSVPVLLLSGAILGRRRRRSRS